MTIAELYGKLSPERPSCAHERLEDLLTSDVFGTMKYAGWQYGFMNWLRSAVSPDGHSCAVDTLPTDSHIRHVHFVFWPTLRNGREPDLLLGIETYTGELLQIMVEAKYYSGTSDIEMSVDEMKPELSGNQIADQVNCFPDLFPNLRNRISQSIHLFVTAHDMCPTRIYEVASHYILKKDILLFWLNWQSLCAFLEETLVEDHGRQELINDLIELLKRKDLIPFNGFATEINGDWTALIGRSYWQWWNVAAPALLSPTGFFREEL